MAIIRRPLPYPKTRAEMLTDPELRKKLKELIRKLQSDPKTAPLKNAMDFLDAAAMTAAIESGKVALPVQEAPSDAIRNARLYLDDYGEYVHGYTPVPFHVVWQKALMNPSISRLLITVPPDHAKTQVSGIQYPCYMIGKDRNIHIGLISNTATQAERKSVSIRDTIGLNPKYREVFPNIYPDFHKGWSSAEWYVQRDDPGDKDSTLKAAGFRGPITGDRYDLIILDDIVDQENTVTAYQRERMEEWVRDTVLTRLTPGGKVVAIGTRWHHEDIYAYFTKRGWYVIHMPAINVDPEGREFALWEERHPLEELKGLQTLEPLAFERIYQGNPTPAEGALIKEEWWQWYDLDRRDAMLEFAERVVQTLDTASKDKTINDPSVIMTWALYQNNAYLINVVRNRVQYPQLKQLALSQYSNYKPSAVVIESASSGIALFQDLQQTTNLPVRDFVADRSKVARLNGVLDYIASGRVFLPGSPSRGQVAPFIPEFLRECAEFPLGAHDDQVDTLSMGLMELFSPRKKWATPSFLHVGESQGASKEQTPNSALLLDQSSS